MATFSQGRLKPKRSRVQPDVLPELHARPLAGERAGIPLFLSSRGESASDPAVTQEGAAGVDQALDHVADALHTPGVGLPSEMQRGLGGCFGRDFSTVRIHTDASAAASARALGAAAYTVGHDIVFGTGQYRLDNAPGRLLLAHELTHVAQQSSAVPSSSVRLGARRGPLEHEARTASARAAAGIPTGQLTAQAVQTVQCADEDELRELQSGVPQTIGAAVLGDTGWRFTVAVMQGISGGMRAHTAAGDVAAALARYHELMSSWRAIGKYVGGYLWGLAKGVVSPVVDLWNLIKGGVELALEANRWIVRNAVELFKGPSTWARRAVELEAKLTALRNRAFDAMKQFLENPVEGMKQVRGWLDSLMEKALAKAREIGHGVVDQIFKFLMLDWFEMGKEIGTVVGTVLVQVLLAVFTAEIGNALSAAGKALGSVGSWVLGKMGAVFSTVRSLASSVIRIIEEMASGVLKFVEGLANEIKGLLKWLLELLGPAEEADVAAAGAGKVTAGVVSEAKGVGIGGKAETIEQYLARGGEIKKLPPSGAPKMEITARPRDPDPEALQKLLGEGREGEAAQETTLRRAGMSARPKHHVFPQERRLWFEERGFVGERSIDEFTVELSQAEHEAIHGGGDYRLGRTWGGEWNSRVMQELTGREASLGRRLTFDEIHSTVRSLMKTYGIDRPFVSFR